MIQGLVPAKDVVPEISQKYRPLVIDSAPPVSLGLGGLIDTAVSRHRPTLLDNITNLISKAPLQRTPPAASSSTFHPAFKSILEYDSDEED